MSKHEAQPTEQQIERRNILNEFAKRSQHEYQFQKKTTHECQAKCFGTETKIDKAENCSKYCMYPYMKIRQMNMQKLGPCNQYYDTKMFACEEMKNPEEKSKCTSEVTERFKECQEGAHNSILKNFTESISGFDALVKEGPIYMP